MAQHDVPFISQYADIGSHEWRARGCGIAALKMVIDYWAGSRPSLRVPPLDELLQEGLAQGAYREGIGWTHRGLVAVAQRHGFDGFNVDFAEQGQTPKSADDAFAALCVQVERGPVLVSVHSGMDPNRGGGHIVVVTGIHDGIVFYNDPEQLEQREGRMALAAALFTHAFKRRYIVIVPAGSESPRP
ncbi:MAG TPA: C39 family peptidase [Candidatus Paceibacterota bacterium]|nr:C39 family peptidase [Candidatus Paceibacterota bacterium]